MCEEEVLCVNEISIYLLNLILYNIYVVRNKLDIMKRKEIMKEKKKEGKKMIEYRKYRIIRNELEKRNVVKSYNKLIKEYLATAGVILGLGNVRVLDMEFYNGLYKVLPLWNNNKFDKKIDIKKIMRVKICCIKDSKYCCEWYRLKI